MSSSQVQLDFWGKDFVAIVVLMLHSMLGLGNSAQSWFYIEYLIYTHKSDLLINVCQLFRNCMNDATDNKLFGSRLTAINKVRKNIYYVIYNKFVFYYLWL